MNTRSKFRDFALTFKSAPYRRYVLHRGNTGESVLFLSRDDNVGGDVDQNEIALSVMNYRARVFAREN